MEKKTKKAPSSKKKVGLPASKNPETRQRLKADARRQQLLEAAQRVFVRQGFHGTKTRELAAEAGVNEATFFMHFSSKQEIFDAAITEQLRALVKVQLQEGRAFASAADPKMKDQIGFQAIREIYEAISEMSPLIIAALFFDRDQGKVTYRSDVFPLVKRLRAAAKLSFGLKDDEDGEFVALAAMSLCFSFHVHYEMLGIKPDVNAMAARISSLLMHGALKHAARD